MENFYEMDGPLLMVSPPAAKKKGRPSCSYSRSKAKRARYSGDDRIPRVSCTHAQSAACSAVVLTETDLLYIKGQLYSTQDKIEQDAIILSHLEIMKCKRRRAKIPDKQRRRQRDLTIKYTVLKEDQTKVPVCQASFSSILCVGKDRVTHIAKYWYKKGRARPENRGGYRESRDNIAKKTFLPESSFDDPSGELGTFMTNNAAAIVSSDDSSSQPTVLSQPTAAKIQKTGIQFENQSFGNKEQKAMDYSMQPCFPAEIQMPVQQHLQGSPATPIQPTPRQMLAAPVQVSMARQNPIERPRPKDKKILVVADHHRGVMSNLASLWKSGKLCDAGIGNGSSTVMVHKLVLSAICPKLLSVFNMDIKSHEFLQVNFPKEVSEEALNAFAEYMYNGILDLDSDILEQMKIIARRLDMTEFEQLCDSHLSNIHQPASSPFTNVPLIQTAMQIPALNPSLTSFGPDIATPSMQQSSPSIISRVNDIRQDISETELSSIQIEPAAVFNQESEVPPPTPNKSGNTSNHVINPSIKIEPFGLEDNKYGLRKGRSSNKAFITFSSSSSPSLEATTTAAASSPIPTSSTEFAIPSSEATDVKSTRLKAPNTYGAPPDLPPVSNTNSRSNSMTENSSQPLEQQSNSQSSVELPTDDDTVYPVRLFTAGGDNLPLLPTDSAADEITVNPFIPSEKT